MKKIKVVFVIEIPELGGLTRCNLDIVESLQYDYDISIFHGYTQKGEEEKIKRIWQRQHTELFLFKIRRRFKGFLNIIFFLIQYVYIFNQKLEEIRPTIVITNSFIAAIAVGLLKVKYHYKHIHIFHGYRTDEELSLYDFQFSHLNRLAILKITLSARMQGFLQKIGIMFSDVNLVTSEFSKNLFIKHFSRIPTVFYPPIPLYPHKQIPNNPELNVGIANRIEPRKGIHIFVNAAKIILGKTKNIHFHIFGYVSQEQYFMALFNQESFLNMSWHGPLDYQQLLEAYKHIDVLVMPSTTGETLGFSTLEALSMGIPVIGSDSGATPEILKQISSELIYNILPKDLAAKIMWFENLDQDKKRILSKNCVEFVRNRYNVKQFVDFFDDLITSICPTEVVFKQ